jgi:osmotically-inducible protein OsmY
MRSRATNRKIQPLLLVAVILVTSACAGKNRTIGTFIEDQAITLKMRRLINADKRINQESAVNVLSYNEVLLLTGTASTEATRLSIIQGASSIPKIRQIHDEITVSKKPSLISTLKDTYLTAKVRMRLITKKNVQSSAIKIACNGGIVYLIGLVDDTQKKLVTDVVRKTSGVKRVVTIFEKKNFNSELKLLNYR